jgi:hypothetical protein
MPVFRTVPHSLHLSRYVGTFSPHWQCHNRNVRGGDSLGVNLTDDDGGPTSDDDGGPTDDDDGPAADDDGPALDEDGS